LSKRKLYLGSRLLGYLRRSGKGDLSVILETPKYGAREEKEGRGSKNIRNTRPYYNGVKYRNQRRKTTRGSPRGASKKLVSGRYVNLICKLKVGGGRGKGRE